MAPIAKKRKLIKKMSPPTPYPTKSSVISGQLEKQIENRKNKKPKSKPDRGVLFVKNLPHQFVEAQMKNYFKQFGRVTNLRLVRSKKSGNSKGFAYVEFEVPEVAQVVAETMNNYVMFQKLLKAAYIPPEEQKFNFFKTSVKKIKNSVGKTKYVSNTTRRIMKQMKMQNNWNDETYMKRTEEAMKKLNKIKKKYSNLGINFDNFVVKPGGLLEQNSDSSSTLKGESSGVIENSDDVTEIDEDAVVTPKLTKKRKTTTLENVAASGKNKKSKNLENNSPTVKDLLGDTLPDEDSSDDDVFLPNAKSLVSKQNKSNGKKESLQLEDLLGRTLEDNDDSSDEDFSVSAESGNDYVSVDSEIDELYETADFIKELEALKNDEDIDDNEKDNSDDDDDSDEEKEEGEEKENVKINKKFIKPAKYTKIDLLEKLTKRKPQLGAIQKPNKKSQHTLKKSDKTETLKLVAAKELIKSQKTNNLKKLKKNKKQKV